MRNAAADALYGYYVRKNDFEMAEQYLSFFQRKPLSARESKQSYTKKQAGWQTRIRHTKKFFSQTIR